MNEITVNVTQENINNGTKQNGEYCPIALALKDMGYRSPSVGYDDISFLYGENSCEDWQCSYTPRVVDHFIEAFDSGLEVEPFSFTIERDIEEEEPEPDYYEGEEYDDEC